MGDERSYRVALVADRYVNPAPGGLDGLAVLATAGWGAMQLPDDAFVPEGQAGADAACPRARGRAFSPGRDCTCGSVRSHG